MNIHLVPTFGEFEHTFFEVGTLAYDCTGLASHSEDEDEDPLPGGGEPDIWEGLLGPQQDKQGNYHPSSKDKEYSLFES
jgi:hypothetical protein